MNHEIRYTLMVIFSLCILPSIAQVLTPIYSIQGNTERSPLEGQNIRTSGVVTDVYDGISEFGGYFIQDTIGDDDTETSDGIYVGDLVFDQNLRVGDYVVLTATVEEFFNRTQLTDIDFINVLKTNTAVPTPIELNAMDTTFNFEQVEGMLVRYNQPMIITGNQYFGQLHFGELVLAPSLLPIPTEIWDPNDDPASGTNWNGDSNVEQIRDVSNSNMNSTIILNDRSEVTDPMSFAFADSLEILAAGNSIDSLTGVMNYTFGNYKLEFLIPDHPYHRKFQTTGSNALSQKENSIRILSFNVENYFWTLGERGAEDQAQFDLQTSKLVQAISSTDADIIALQELENNETAIQHLAEALNEVKSIEQYDYIRTPSNQNGGDVIQTAFLFKVENVEPVNNAYNIGDESIFDRKPLAQRFRHRQASELDVLIINVHLKSKSCSNASGLNENQNDGQACFNKLRKQQAETILNYIRSEELLANEIIDILVLGDFNAYSQEDPIDLLRDGGLLDESQITDQEITAASFQFANQHGRLDHVLVSPHTASKINRIQYWDINSRYSDLIGYDSYNPDFINFYKERSSDHDPLIIDYGDFRVSTVDKGENDEISIFHNSQSRIIYINTKESGIQHVDLFNPLGQLVYTRSGQLGMQHQITTESLTAGIYYVRLITSNNSITSKAVFVD